MARDLEVSGAKVIARGGAKLEEMRRERGVNERTIYIFGICDLWKRGDANIERHRVRALEAEIDSMRGKSDEVLCTIYPIREASNVDAETIRLLNRRIAEVNMENRWGTPGLHNIMYYRERGIIQIKKSMYESDGIHWNAVAKSVAEEKLSTWIRINLKSREVNICPENKEIERLKTECERNIEEYEKRMRKEMEEKVRVFKRKEEAILEYRVEMERKEIMQNQESERKKGEKRKREEVMIEAERRRREEVMQSREDRSVDLRKTLTGHRRISWP